MRSLFLLASLSLATTFISAQDIVEFKVSKPYSVLNFLETAIGAQGTSVTLKKFIETSIPKIDTGFYNLAKSFSRINLSYNYRRDEIPANRHQFRSTHDLIIIAAVHSENIPEFKANSIGILPNSEHQELFRVLTVAEMYYDNLMVPYLSDMEEQLVALSDYQKRVNSFFNKFKSFYNSTWTDDIPFAVTFYPIPGKKGNTTATPHVNSLCVGVLTGETNHVQRIGVVLHEMCHVLYDEQLSSFQKKLDAFFQESSSPYRNLAYNYFDEALATALGNGWAYERIEGEPDTTSWYNDKYIDRFAHALYPMVSQYLADKKVMDKNFIDEAIRLFGEAFPKSTSDFSILLNNMYLYTDADQDERQQIKNMILDNFRVSRFSFSSPILHEYSIASMKSAKETQLILIDRDQASVLSKIKEIFPVINGYLQNKATTNFILSFYDESRRPVVIICVDSPGLLNTAMEVMGKQQYLDEANPYTEVK